MIDPKVLGGAISASCRLRTLGGMFKPRWTDHMKLHPLVLAGACAIFCIAAKAADQTQAGSGNALANQIAARSQRVQEAHAFLLRQARQVQNPALRQATLDLLGSTRFCITARAGLSAATKAKLVADLAAANLIDPADELSFPGGLIAGVFPAIADEATTCPHMPMNFDAAPGSSFSSHHGYPGGLPIHEANNARAALGLADGYRKNYSASHVDSDHDDRDHDEDHNWLTSSLMIDQDIIIAAPIWHDWGKTMVFQWTADGQEYKELNFGGTPANGSATGGHHIISIAESIKRKLPPAFVIAQASAHSNPTLGNEYKVVNWIRAASILAQVDPVQAGYLTKDSTNAYRLPALRKLGDGLDLNAGGQTNLLPEYTLHNLSDGDYTFSIPAASDAALILAKLAPSFGFDPGDTANYNNLFRNPVLSQISQERLLIVYANKGLDAVKSELAALHARGGF
jgi:hypothetical protein